MCSMGLNKELVIVYFGRPLDYAEAREISLLGDWGKSPYEGEEVRVAHNCVIYMPSLRYLEEGPILLSTSHLFAPEGVKELIRAFCHEFYLGDIYRVGWYIQKVESL